MSQIIKINTKQTAKFFFFFYLILSAIILIPVAIIGAVVNIISGNFAEIFISLGLISAGVFYAFIGFICVLIFSLSYNFTAKRFGGIDIELKKETLA